MLWCVLPFPRCIMVTLCPAFAGKCLVPGSYTRNCSSFASQPITEKLNVVAVHAQAQHVLLRSRSSGGARAAAFIAGGNESVMFSPVDALHWRKECVVLFPLCFFVTSCTGMLAASSTAR